MPPIKLTFADNLPTKMRPHSRIVSPKLIKNAKLEFNRLKQYIYVDSDSHIASPLVITPKATAPYIRLCGDYREINKYIKCPADAIPYPLKKVQDAQKFLFFCDIDMTNSFH